jgi:hypothetical protein
MIILDMISNKFKANKKMKSQFFQIEIAHDLKLILVEHHPYQFIEFIKPLIL